MPGMPGVPGVPQLVSEEHAMSLTHMSHGRSGASQDQLNLRATSGGGALELGLDASGYRAPLQIERR